MLEVWTNSYSRQITSVTFNGNRSTSQEMYHELEQHDAISQCSQSMWDVQEDRGVLPDNKRDLANSSTESIGLLSHEATITGTLSKKNTSNQATEASTVFHVSENGLAGSTATNLGSNSNGNTSDRERNVGHFSVPLPQISPGTVEMSGLTPEMAISPGFRCLDLFHNGSSTQTHHPTTCSDLEALDYLTSQPNTVDLLTSTTQQGESLQSYPTGNSDLMKSPSATKSALVDSPDLLSIYYPNATYQDLHTTLYHHIVETARNTALTRQASPNPFTHQAPTIVPDAPSSSLNINKIPLQIQKPGLRLQPVRSIKMTQQRQLELWRNYLDEIAVWLDMFDNERNFQFKIPILAKSADHLHYSILALSARQMERQDPYKPYTESLELYQEAIQLVVNELYTLDTAVIASCILLCVLEMMSSSPRAWGRHLNGCAMLLEAAGVNGAIGGVRQSLFWCFARMDVWGGFLEDTLTKIPTSRWFIPSGSMIEAVNHFKAGFRGDSYANYAVFLCASVVNVISNKNGPSVGQTDVDSPHKSTYSARWTALFELLEDWYNNRPEEMQPLMAYPSTSNEPREPFSVVLYGSSPAVNGNQLYHAAALLMLQDKPRGLRLSNPTKSILWHARQICGIAVSNSDHGAWINSLQPIWIAGKIMSHESEHRAILALLAKIERETGWATAWRAKDLRDFWGDAECSEMH